MDYCLADGDNQVGHQQVDLQESLTKNKALRIRTICY